MLCRSVRQSLPLLSSVALAVVAVIDKGKLFHFQLTLLFSAAVVEQKHDDEGFVAAWQVSWGWSEKVGYQPGRRRILKFQIMFPAE